MVHYISAPFTMKIKSILKKCEINARVVEKSGAPLKFLMSKKNPKKICSCILCSNNIPCHISNVVYKLSCKNCKDTNSFYIGATARKTIKRLEEHEHSVRKFNKRTTSGEHMALKHKRNKPRKSLPNQINFKNLLKHYKVEILKTCKDPLECFISEGLYIKKLSPNLNNHLENGFIK